MFKLGIKI